MPTYVYDRDTDSIVEVEWQPRPQSKFPSIQRDHAAYVSPLTGKVIEGRYARREEMKRQNVREVDPSEKPARVPEPDYVKHWRKNEGIVRSNPNE
jgi:hypothetical protein